ncbi:peptidase [Clostridium polyendosporum]|uniref:Peptidase n=1 Tax=Clostridium polyendosporum TaxID=69208 RepID=A0A919VGS9_9CLOT|nr:M23 family metallopeptidase [Clostridium polyendosporum]GIM29685.1 peptidase [Clostridium polyendosporum]
MDKKNNKFISFIKKESFYVILFVCLCVVATVAAFTARNANKVTEQQEKGSVAMDINENEKKSTTQMIDAEQVKNTQSKTNNESKTNSQSKASNVTVPNSKAVSNNSKVSFINPIADGSIVRQFSDKPIKLQGFEKDTWTTLRGVAIAAKKGTPVKAAADGKVTEVEDGDGFLGYYVVLSHPNGMRTIYTNLDPQVVVKKGSTVKANDVIGKVGDTARMLKFESYAEHLGFQVVDSKDEQVDPTKLIKFDSQKSK